MITVPVALSESVESAVLGPISVFAQNKCYIRQIQQPAVYAVERMQHLRCFAVCGCGVRPAAFGGGFDQVHVKKHRRIVKNFLVGSQFFRIGFVKFTLGFADLARIKPGCLCQSQQLCPIGAVLAARKFADRLIVRGFVFATAVLQCAVVEELLEECVQ